MACGYLTVYLIPLIDESVSTTGPIEDVKDVRTEPFTLPDKFCWDEINVQNDSEVSARQMRWVCP